MKQMDKTEKNLGYRKYKVGDIGVISNNENPHYSFGAVKGTFFEILEVSAIGSSCWYPYKVMFFDNKLKKLNSQGPLLDCTHIHIPKNITALKVLYGKI